MLNNTSITDIMNGAIKSVEDIIPTTIHVEEPKIAEHEETIICLGVQVMLIGDIQAKLIIQGDTNIFQKVAGLMFGMELEGDMLISFTGELGNMIGGKVSMQISNLGIHTDITTPNVLTEEHQVIIKEDTVVTNIHLQEYGKFQLFVCLV